MRTRCVSGLTQRSVAWHCIWLCSGVEREARVERETRHERDAGPRRAPRPPGPCPCPVAWRLAHWPSDPTAWRGPWPGAAEARVDNE